MYRSPFDIIRSVETIKLSEYQSLAELRYQIRRFVHFSEQAARQARMEPRQHQLLLSLKGLPANMRPTVGGLAERLQIRPHSAVELANRLVKGGFLRRQRDRNDKDRREVLLHLTAKGENVLRQLSLHHRAELRTAGPALMVALRGVLKSGKPRRNPR
jgi:DNA-binding MarR family transcriptional regulator